MKNVMLIFGTRPEAIKMGPVARALKSRTEIRLKICVTGQHGSLLDDALRAFDMVPDYNLALMRENQTLFDITRGVLGGLDEILVKESPDVVLVHGDTSTAFAASLACFYLNIPVGHVEAGLRTRRLDSPHPEEFNRQTIDLISRYHFAPTQTAVQNLLDERISPETVFLTGNTSIDALKTTVRENFSHPLLDWVGARRYVLLTVHRRESAGQPLRRVLHAVRQIADSHPETAIIYPVHPSPAIGEAGREILAKTRNIMLTEPLDVVTFHNLLARCDMIFTDSGGIQEEADFLGKPVLVLRDVTERTEAMGGGQKLAGTREDDITELAETMLADQKHAGRGRLSGIYGDGQAGKRIADILVDESE